MDQLLLCAGMVLQVASTMGCYGRRVWPVHHTHKLSRCLAPVWLLLALLLATASARAQERTAPNGVAARLFAGPNQGGLGLAYQRDFRLPLRIGIAAGWFGVGDGSNSWESLELGGRLLEATGGASTSLVPALFATAGLAHYYDEQRPDGYQTHRDTLAATVGLVGELRPPQGRSGGFLLDIGVQGIAALKQDIQSHPYRQWQPYAFTEVGSISMGYAF